MSLRTLSRCKSKALINRLAGEEEEGVQFLPRLKHQTLHIHGVMLLSVVSLSNHPPFLSRQTLFPSFTAKLCCHVKFCFVRIP